MRYPKLSRCRGMSMVELMIAMALGTFLLAGVTSVFVSTGRVGRTNDNLARLQDSARAAYSLIARDVREAGMNDCGRFSPDEPVVNVLNNAAVTPLINWAASYGLVGYDGATASPGVNTGAAAGERVGGTEAIHVMSGGSQIFTVVSHNIAGSFTLTDSPDLIAGQVVVACDYGAAALLQVGAVAGRVVSYDTTGAAPGNCSIGLGRSIDPCATPNTYGFQINTRLTPFYSTIWYVGNNGRPDTGGRSLYRMRLVTDEGGGGVTAVAEEIAEGVSDLQFNYLSDPALGYVNAAAIGAGVANWLPVTAVEISVTVQSPALEVGADGVARRIQRTFTNVIALRNRQT